MDCDSCDEPRGQETLIGLRYSISTRAWSTESAAFSLPSSSCSLDVGEASRLKQ